MMRNHFQGCNIKIIGAIKEEIKTAVNEGLIKSIVEHNFLMLMKTVN